MLNKMLFILLKKFFERNPKREMCGSTNKILSPADGKVLYVKPIKNSIVIKKGIGKINISSIIKSKKYKMKEGHVIAIYMSPFDIHINRSPATGIIEKIFYEKGKFLRTSNKYSEIINERNCIVIKTKRFRIIVIQIAAKFFGKIVCNLKEGQKIKIGDIIGMITLGSQINVIVPKNKNLKIRVKKGEKVYAGISSICYVNT